MRIVCRCLASLFSKELGACKRHQCISELSLFVRCYSKSLIIVWSFPFSFGLSERNQWFAKFTVYWGFSAYIYICLLFEHIYQQTKQHPPSHEMFWHRDTHRYQDHPQRLSLGVPAIKPWLHAAKLRRLVFRRLVGTPMSNVRMHLGLFEATRTRVSNNTELLIHDQVISNDIKCDMKQICFQTWTALNAICCWKNWQNNYMSPSEV